MKSYCVKEKRDTLCEPGTEQIMVANNGRKMVVCKCASCGITKTQFMRNNNRIIGRGKNDDPDDDKNYTCGLDPNKKPYSMEKCLEKKQVRYWGKNKIDSRLLASATQGLDPNKRRMKLISDRIAVIAALKKLREDKLYTNRFETEKLADIAEKAEQLIKKKNTIEKQLKKFNKPGADAKKVRKEIPIDLRDYL